MSPIVYESPGMQNMKVSRMYEVLVKLTELPSNSNENASLEEIKLPDTSTR